MSREREAALRDAHKAKELEELMKAQALRVTDAPEDAMHTIWNSERKILVDGKWYVPISEVSEILTTPTEEPEPLSEEWQAQCFPNLNIGNIDASGMGEPINASIRTMVESEPNNMQLGGHVREAYWKERNKEEARKKFMDESDIAYNRGKHK